MARRAYYKYENDYNRRDIHVMAAELHEFDIPYKLNEYSLRVGDRILVRLSRDGCANWGDPIFNSYNDALRWLIADERDLYVSDSGHIVINEPIVSKLSFDFDSFNTAWCASIIRRSIPGIKRIELNTKKGIVYTTVIWTDGSEPTVVKKSEDDTNDPYFAVASAIAIKAYGSNSAFKREIEEKIELRNQVYGYGFEDLPSLIDTSLR